MIDQSELQAYSRRMSAIVRRGLEQGFTASKLMGEIVAAAEEEVSTFLSVEERALVACGPGCSSCCRVNVSVLWSEAAAIAAYLRGELQTPAVEELAKRLADIEAKVRWMDDEERIRHDIPCAFLDGRGWCSIHPVRPLLCRSITSTDPDLCRKALDLPEDEEDEVVMNLVQKYLFEEAFRQLGEAFAEAGFESRSRELTGSVRLFLVDQRLAERMIEGLPFPPNT